ncbi:MAG: hypothetical protein RMJ97_11595 [Raineya sp.]|nr:hypothetical protein [Raineya sp.]MDW8297515.1 hypothetical protein [Raineya sp.]
MFSIVQAPETNNRLKELFVLKSLLDNVCENFSNDFPPVQVQKAILDLFFVVSELKNNDELAKEIENCLGKPLQVPFSEIKRVTNFLCLLQKDFEVIKETFESYKKN